MSPHHSHVRVSYVLHHGGPLVFIAAEELMNIHASKVVVKSHTTPTGHLWILLLWLRKTFPSFHHDCDISVSFT